MSESFSLQIISIIFGLIIGSFLTACAYRIPYGRQKGFDDDDDDNLDEDTAAQQINIFFPPRSFCPGCTQQLLWWHNIPVISWLLLGGKCAFCAKKIPLRYPCIELFTAATCWFAFQLFDLPTASVVFVFCCALIVLSVIDSEYYILPNVITYPGMIFGLALGAANQFFHLFTLPIVPDLTASFWGLLCGGGFLFLVSELYFRIRKRVGLGFGDVKLLAMTGLWFGPECALYTIFLGSFVGAVLGGLALLILGHKMGKPLPFGPYLAAGTYIYIFLQPELSHLVIM